MDRLDEILERAAADLRASVQAAEATPTMVKRRTGRRRLALVASLALLLGIAGLGALLVYQPNSYLAGQAGEALITSEMILQDGVVTEEEYRAGAEAVVSCLAAAGFDVEVSFDRPNGHANFSGNHADDLRERYRTEFGRCIDLHLSENVSLGWAAALGQLNLAEWRRETTEIVACVETRTGRDFGELTFDEFDYLTPQGQQTREAAFEYGDHQPWERCRSDLGLEISSPPETFSTLEKDPLEIAERNGMVLTISGPLDAPCVEVRSELEMAGGCGGDLTDPLSLGLGGIAGQSFVYGWVTKDATTVVITLADGSQIEVAELIPVEGVDVRFFLEVIGPMRGTETELPVTAVALNRNGKEMARFVLEETDQP